MQARWLNLPLAGGVWCVAAYLLIGTWVFGPAGKLPSLRQAVVFLLPLVPLIRLAYPEYRARTLQAVVEVFLAVAAVVVAFAVPAPEGSWSPPWAYACGAATPGLMTACWAWRLPHRWRLQHEGPSSRTGAGIA
ncbi:hypothetical protein QFZ57_002993 [Arthrobacter sp. B1I2]|nr:hypothetical protein [Arthrobacter sp. B1I2]